MRNIIDKKTAIKVCTLIISLIAILTIWPFRIWTGVSSFTAGGELVETSEYINYEASIEQKFITRYERLSAIDVYVSEMTNGRYICVSVCDETGRERLKRIIDTDGYEIPGYVPVPLELDVEVGKEYYLVFSAARSKYYLGYEDVPDNSEYAGSLYYNWNEIPARHVALKYSYRIPLHKGLSLIAIAIIAALCAAVLTATDVYYKRNSDRNTILTVEQTVKFVANPVAILIFGALMIMVFPLRIFDLRAVDILFYEIGLVITCGIVLYAINHKVVRHQVGISFWQDIENKDRFIYILMMLAIALSIWYACEYMNDLYDIFHTLSQRRITICLLALVMLTFSFMEVVNPANVLWLVVSVISGIVYYRSSALADTEKEYDLHNMALKYLIIIIVMAGFVVINLCRNCVHGEYKGKLRLTPFGAMLLLLFAALIIFRNTRTWGIVLVTLFVALYLRLVVWRGFKDWYKILSGGLMLNFAISLAFSLLHRYFAGYTSGRFAFIFHTVTVTAEYLTFMGAAATVMLVIKIVEFPKHSRALDLFKSAWKEIVLFGWIMSYAIFTVSRTAYVAIVICILAVVLVVIVRNKGQFVRLFCAMLVSVLICFPAAFTLQRIIPTIVADPVFYEIDDTDILLRGGANWRSTNFMCVERFVNLFASKILGSDYGDYKYPEDVYNYDENGDPILDIYGYPVEDACEEIYQGKNVLDADEGNLLVSNAFTRAEYLMLLDALNGYVDEGSRLDVLSNGRITIFKSYLKELNLTGHDEMGALLPNGEIAVHAHNTYLQVAYDNGIITAVIFIMVIFAAVVSSLRKYAAKEKDEPLTLMAFAVIIGFIVCGFTEWVFLLGNPMTIALMLSFAGLVFKEERA